MNGLKVIKKNDEVFTMLDLYLITILQQQPLTVAVIISNATAATWSQR